MKIIVVKDIDRDIFIESILVKKEVPIYVIICDKSVEVKYQRVVDMGILNNTENITKYLEQVTVILDSPSDKEKVLKHLDDLVVNRYKELGSTVFVVVNESFSKEIATRYNDGKNLTEVII